MEIISAAAPRQAITSHMAIAALAQLYLLGIAVLIAAAICRWRSLKPIVLAWLAGFALEAAICIFDSLAMLTGRSMLYPSVAHRIRGTFRTSAQLASFSLMSFFVILAGSRLLAREKSLKMASYLLAGLAPLFIVLASRRSTLASLAVGFVVLLIISRHRVRIFLSTVVPVGVAIVTLYFFVPPEIHAYFTRRIEPLLGEDPHRVGVAIDHFRRGVEAFQEHPVLGVGFGAFKETRFGFWEENVEVVDEGKSMTHEQHSGYVAILAETGTIGFASMMFIHLAVLWVILGVWLRGPYPLSGLAADFLVLFAALATSEIYNRIWRERSLWVVLGIVAVLPTLVAFSRPQLRNAGSRLQAVGRSAWGGMVRRPGSYQSGTSL